MIRMRGKVKRSIGDLVGAAFTADISHITRGHHLRDRRGENSLIMIGIHTDHINLEIKGAFTDGQMFEFILVEIGPAPDLRVDHVGESLAAGDL